MMEPCPPLTDAWVIARDRYTEDLSEEEKQMYKTATLENIFYSASAAEKSHEATSRSRRYMAKLQPLIDAIEQYGQAFDVYSNAHPLVLSPIWGSMRVLFHVKNELPVLAIRG